MPNADLKQCPFCASTDLEVRWTPSNDDCAVTCNNCGALGPNELSVKAAFESWGMRRSHFPAPYQVNTLKPKEKMSKALDCTVCGRITPVNQMYSVDACSERCQGTVTIIAQLRADKKFLAEEVAKYIAKSAAAQKWAKRARRFVEYAANTKIRPISEQAKNWLAESEEK